MGLADSHLRRYGIVADETYAEKTTFLGFDIASELVLVGLKHIHAKELCLFMVDLLIIF